jgi:hypothetical protein
MADYADDAVVVTPPGMVPAPAGLEEAHGVFVGKENATKLFAILTDAEHLPGTASMQSTTQPLSPDTILLHWSVMPGTPQQTDGMDSFTIRNGKIVFQTVALKAPPAAPAP